MATKTTVTKVCDMTGDAADETIEFGLDGVAYTIDLTGQRAGVLRDILADFTEHARKLGKLSASNGSGGTRRSTASAGARPSREQTAAVRSWARNNGFTVSDRGRISAEVQQAFDEAHRLASVG